MTIEEIRKYGWEQKSKILSDYLVSFRNIQWPKPYSERYYKKKMDEKLENLLKNININDFFKIACLRELKSVTERATIIWEEYKRNMGKEDTKKMKNLLEKTENVITELNKWKKNTENSIGRANWIDKDYGNIFNPTNDVLSQLKQEVLRLVNEEEQRSAEQEEEKRVLDQLKSLDPGIQINIDRLGEICILDKESTIRIIKNLLQKNSDLGKYYEKQQVFLPDSSLISEIDKLFKMFENGINKKK